MSSQNFYNDACPTEININNSTNTYRPMNTSVTFRIILYLN